MPATPGYNAGVSSDDSFARHLLIAMPAMNDPNFARGLVFLCQHNAEGAMGLVINRQSELCVGDVLEHMGIATDDRELAERPVLMGGPVQPDSGFVLHDDGSAWASTLRIDQRLSLTTSRDILEAMAQGQGPVRALLALGYAGWEAGQLESELVDNVWLTIPADPALIFDLPLAQRWIAATRRLGVDPDQLADYAGHA